MSIYKDYLRSTLEHELVTGHNLDLSAWSSVPVMELKARDQDLCRILDEYGSLDYLYREKPEIYRLASQPEKLQLVRTYLNYAYKVKVGSSQAQNQKAREGFLERNKQCYEWTKTTAACKKFPSSQDERIFQVAKYLATRRCAYYRGPSLPSHGPGVASNAPAIRIKKYESLARDVPMSLRRFAEFFVPSPNYAADFQPKDWPSECKLSAVPKDARGPRLIAPHSVSHMWMQQAVARSLVTNWVRQEQWYKYHLPTDSMVSTMQFTDQSYNQLLALFASIRPGLWSTIDLSDASDRIPWSLVRALVPYRLWKDLSAVRARYVVTGKQRNKLHMHAPMGSACCFPILSLVVWCLTCATIWCDEHEGLPGRDTIPSEFDSVFVFGDDVILSSNHLSSVIRTFTAFNMKVNERKSYGGPGGFRESCGCDAYGGAVITPLRLKVDGVSCVQDLLTLVEHANALRELKLDRTSKAVLDLIEIEADRLGVRHLIAASTEEKYTGCVRFPDLDHCKKWNKAGGVRMRYNRKLQRSEMRAFAFETDRVRTGSDIDSRSRLFEGTLGNRAPSVAG